MGKVSIDEEEISLRELMILDEVALQGIRRSNAESYEAHIRELLIQEDASRERLNGIKSEINAAFAEREKDIVDRQEKSNAKIAEAHNLFELAKQALVDAKEIKAQNEERTAALNREKENFNARVQFISDEMAVKGAYFENLENDLNAKLALYNARMAKINQQEKDANELFQKRIKEDLEAMRALDSATVVLNRNKEREAVLTLLIRDAQEKAAKAEEVIKKLGNRWIKREV